MCCSPGNGVWGWPGAGGLLLASPWAASSLCAAARLSSPGVLAPDAGLGAPVVCHVPRKGVPVLGRGAGLGVQSEPQAERTGSGVLVPRSSVFLKGGGHSAPRSGVAAEVQNLPG